MVGLLTLELVAISLASLASLLLASSTVPVVMASIATLRASYCLMATAYRDIHSAGLVLMLSIVKGRFIILLKTTCARCL